MDMQMKEMNKQILDTTGFDIRKTRDMELPETEEELQLHMQLTYKQSIELAEEQALNVLFDGNKYELIKSILL